jgi:hypothetical protein
VAEPVTVLIAASDLLSALKARTGALNGEVLSFSDTEAVGALEAILARRPHTIALERQFAATPRGAALINRIKADPLLVSSELLVVAHDSDYSRVLPRGPASMMPAVSAIPVIAAASELAPPPVVAPPLLDQRGTRRAPRFKIAGEMSVLVDGNAARLVDLSEVGAQVISPIVLKPNQRVRIALTDDHGALRFNAAIAWAFFEIPSNRGPQYRAGINFVDADGNAVGAFCVRHKV